MIPFAGNKDVTAVSSKIQVPPLLRKRHNAALALLFKPSFGLRSSLSLRPLFYLE